MMFVPCHLYHIIPLALAMFVLFLLGPRKRHSPQNPNCWSCCPLLRHPIPISPGLDPSTLETAWSLSDVDRDGTLTLGSADCPKLMETQKSHCDWRMGKMVIKHGILGYPVLRQPQSGQIAPKNPKVKPAVWPKDLPWVLLLHSPDHQRDAWGPHAQFARRPATATLGIADEPGTLGDPGGGEGGNSFAKLARLLLFYSDSSRLSKGWRWNVSLTYEWDSNLTTQHHAFSLDTNNLIMPFLSVHPLPRVTKESRSRSRSVSPMPGFLSGPTPGGTPRGHEQRTFTEARWAPSRREKRKYARLGGGGNNNWRILEEVLMKWWRYVAFWCILLFDLVFLCLVGVKWVLVVLWS